MGFMMIFRNYERTQEEKMKLIAKCSYGTVLDVDGSDNPNRFFDLNNSVKEVWLLDIQEPINLPSKYIKKFIKFDLNKVIKENLPFKDEYFDTEFWQMF